MSAKITTIFCDIGGVLLTNGWGTESRKAAAKLFGYNFEESESRHRLLFDDFETGKISLYEYLHYAIFYEPRKFSMEEFKQFIYHQSQPLPGMLEFLAEIKKQHNLKVVVTSNEGRELIEYRIDTFGLKDIVDIFIVSCFVGIKKPDKAFYKFALDAAQVNPHEVVYLDDRQLFVQIAKDLGIHAIHHTDLQTTKEKFLSLIQNKKKFS